MSSSASSSAVRFIAPRPRLLVVESFAQEGCDAVFAELLKGTVKRGSVGEQRGEIISKDGIFRWVAPMRRMVSALHVGKKRRLCWAFVEAVDLIDEEDGSGVHFPRPEAAAHHDLLDLLDCRS